MRSVEQGRGYWNFTFIRIFNDQEMDHVEVENTILYVCAWGGGWRTKNGVFYVKSFYKVLDRDPSPFPSGRLGRHCI